MVTGTGTGYSRTFFSKRGHVVNRHLAQLLTSGHVKDTLHRIWDCALLVGWTPLVLCHSLQNPGAMLDMAQ